jgi:hypothetical protein
MLLEESDLYSLHRRGRYLFAALKRPHRVLSTFGVNGGLREDLTHIANHQSCDESALLAAARTELDATTATVFARNRLAIVHDPQSAAAAYGLAEILDLTRAGVLHAEAARESILNQAALLAATVAVDPERFADFRALLQPRQELNPGALAALAVVKGFARKWI